MKIIAIIWFIVGLIWYVVSLMLISNVKEGNITLNIVVIILQFCAAFLAFYLSWFMLFKNPYYNIEGLSIKKRILIIFNPKCPRCGSKDNKVEIRPENPYALNGKIFGRVCNNCKHFWCKFY